MTEYTPRQYADAAMFLLSGVELSNADRGTLARMMRAAIAQGFDPAESEIAADITTYDVTTGRGIYQVKATSAAEAREIFRRRISREAILRVDVNRGSVVVPLFR